MVRRKHAIHMYTYTYEANKLFVVHTPVAITVCMRKDDILHILRQFLISTVAQHNGAIAHLRQRNATWTLVLAHARTHVFTTENQHVSK